MRLRPSEIRFSQDSISNTFDRGFTSIGQLVNEVIEGRTKLSDIPKIHVAKINGKWVTLDNRRLWVFQTLESRGRCTDIEVIEVGQIPEAKRTSKNGGESVRVRGDPYRASGRSTRRRHSDLFDIDDDLHDYDDYGDDCFGNWDIDYDEFDFM